MNTLSKYFIPGLCLLALIFEMCKPSPVDKEEKTGKAGDQFDLFAALHTFENSSSPEAFEKSLNSKSVGVNNLDLNEDGETDYIRVTDKKIDDKSHVLILQVDVAKGKTQDVATIEIEKTGEKEAHIQMIGDEDLYGSDYIVEPQSKDAAAGFVVATTFAVNVWTWPAVAFVYSPAYVVWVSPYYYEYYPVWWEPWPVVVYDVYYPIVSVHHVHYGFSDGYRFVNIHEKYHSNYRVTAHFNYHENNHGTSSNSKVKVKEGSSGNKGDGWKENGGGNKSNGGSSNSKSNGGDKKSAPANDKVKQAPAKDNSKTVPGNDKKSGGKNYNSPSDNKGSAPKTHAKQTAPTGNGGGNKSVTPKSQPKQPASPSKNNTPNGAKTGGGGGHGGGGKHK